MYMCTYVYHTLHYITLHYITLQFTIKLQYVHCIAFPCLTLHRITVDPLRASSIHCGDLGFRLTKLGQNGPMNQVATGGKPNE